MTDQRVSTTTQTTKTQLWREIVAKYQKPAIWRGIWQTLNTLVPYAILWVLIYFSLKVAWWLTIPLAVLASGFLLRIFVLFHDCGHGSFFPSRKANDILGFITGVLTCTPYRQWSREHAIHHATSGDLDRRGTGDIWTLTVQEYLEASRWRRLAYRLARNPFVLFVLAPLFLFLVKNRIPKGSASRRERHSVYWTNLAVLAMAAGLSYL